MYINIVCHIDVSVTKEFRQHLDVHAFVVTVRSEGMSKNMFAAILYFCFFAKSAGLMPQCFIQEG